MDMLSLVTPVYKSEENLPSLLRELEAFAATFSDALEVVFVVDGSPDSSLRILRVRERAWIPRANEVGFARWRTPRGPMLSF